MQIVLSAVQRTGDLHIGNYFGAVQNWVKLQDKYHCTYGVVDLHSMTMPYNPTTLKENTWKMIYYLLACGVKPENLFVQSMVPEHTELAWILSCVASYGDLTRMTQFKDKGDQLAETDKDAFVSVGLFGYRILQAADILIYNADYVPVGKDQEQHLELSRSIAERFNRQFKKEVFKMPQPLFTETPKILSPANPLKKMSKSMGEKHYINLFAEPDRVRKQIRSAVTDTGEPAVEGVMSAGVANLFELLRACENRAAHDSLMLDYQAGSLKYSDLKEEVAETLVRLITPLRERLEVIHSDKKAVKQQIKESSSEIRKKAQETMRIVREVTGL